MRWEQLFADLSAELDASAAAELEVEIADRTRSERARLRLVDRLRGSMDLAVDIRLHGAGSVSGALGHVGPDWVLLRAGGGSDHVVRLDTVLEIGGLADYSAAPGSEGVVTARFSFGAVLRRLARDRAVVTVLQVDGRTVIGTVERAGADFVEVSDRRSDDPAPAWAARPVRRTIPVHGIAAIRH